MFNAILNSCLDLSKAIILTIKISILQSFPCQIIVKHRQLTKSPLSSFIEMGEKPN